MATSLEIETWPPAREQFYEPYFVCGDMIGEPGIRSVVAVMRTETALRGKSAAT